MSEIDEQESSRAVIALEMEIKELKAKIKNKETELQASEQSGTEERSWKELDLERQYFATLQAIEEQKVINRATEDLVHDLQNQITEIETAASSRMSAIGQKYGSVVPLSDDGGGDGREKYLRGLLEKATADKMKALRVLARLTGNDASD